MLKADQDAIGNAIADYFKGIEYAAVAVFSTVDDNYFLECKELFRSYDEMSAVDQKALSLCSGKILDVGAGAGSHSLYLQENYDVTALEISPLSCETMSKRGVKKVLNADFFEFETEQKFDTILLMMNGIGFVGSVNGLRDFFDQCYELLNEGGKIVFDSTFRGDDHKQWCDLNDNEYGKVDYQMIYNEFATDSFYWLYIDFSNIQQIAAEHNFTATLEFETETGEYVASVVKG